MGGQGVAGRVPQGGRLRLSLHAAGTALELAHGVEAEEHEPGLSEDEQAHLHKVDLLLVDTRLTAELALNDRVGVAAELPVRAVRAVPTFEGPNGEPLPGFSSIHHRRETISGLGDLELGGRVRLVAPDVGRRWSLDVRAGLSTPTGGTEPDPFELVRQGRHHQHIFFGSGTFDPLFGVQASWAPDALGALGAAALSAQASVRAPLYANPEGYRAPTLVTGAVGFDTGLLPGPHGFRLLVAPEVYHETPATWSGQPDNNSGRTDLIAAAGVLYAPPGPWSAHLLVKAPWTVRSAEGHIDIPAFVALGVSYETSVWQGSGS